MSSIPLDIGKLHFIGIGGIGMSGIAETLHNLGYDIQGSDVAESANVQRLRAKGIEVVIGHRTENVAMASVVVVSSAIRLDNPEIIEARKRIIPIVHRAEMLVELMRFRSSIAVGGTHGKTTTTSMIASLLEGGNLDPTVINGGIINAYGTNARLGSGKWMVVEADESDGSFIKLPATVSVITNIDPEHMEFYGSLEALREAFASFVQNIPFYGFSVLCIDHPVVQSLVGKVGDRRIVTYGFNPQAEVRALGLKADLNGTRFDVEVFDRKNNETRGIEGFYLPMPGDHNVLNALAAIAVSLQLDLSEGAIRKGLSSFGGVKRRFTKTGEVRGVTIVDDYAHHPVEIMAVLKAARQAVPEEGRVFAVAQPHRYSRLRDHFEGFCSCFNDADGVIIGDVYAAGESPIEGFDRDSLVTGLLAHGHRMALPLERPEDLPAMIKEQVRAGDLVVCVGAGSITAWANALPQALEVLYQGA